MGGAFAFRWAWTQRGVQNEYSRYWNGIFPRRDSPHVQHLLVTETSTHTQTKTKQIVYYDYNIAWLEQKDGSRWTYLTLVMLTPVAVTCSANLLSAAIALYKQQRKNISKQSLTWAKCAEYPWSRTHLLTFSRSVSDANLFLSSVSNSCFLFSSFCSFSRCFLCAFWAFFFSAFLDSISAVSGPGTLRGTGETNESHLMHYIWRVKTVHSYLCLNVVILVQILTHVFTEDIPCVLVRGHNIRSLPFVIPVKEEISLGICPQF